MTREEQIDRITAAAREALGEIHPDNSDLVEEVLGSFGLVIAECATEEQIENLIAYFKETNLEPIPMTVVKEREEVDDMYFDFRPPH